MILLKEQKTVRVDTEEQAKALIEENKSTGEYVLDSQIKNKNKKSKGEIVEEWVELTLTKKYIY